MVNPRVKYKNHGNFITPKKRIFFCEIYCFAFKLRKSYKISNNQAGSGLTTQFTKSSIRNFREKSEQSFFNKRKHRTPPQSNKNRNKLVFSQTPSRHIFFRKRKTGFLISQVLQDKERVRQNFWQLKIVWFKRNLNNNFFKLWCMHFFKRRYYCGIT